MISSCVAVLTNSRRMLVCLSSKRSVEFISALVSGKETLHTMRFCCACVFVRLSSAN